jgi:LuxR family transcriptional regulator, regulator of acetate metabolism
MKVIMKEPNGERAHLMGAVAPGAAPANLSPRELETMSLLRLGLSDKEIAHRMDIQTCTVNAFLKRIFPKLGTHTRRQAVQKVFGTAPGS